MRLKPM